MKVLRPELAATLGADRFLREITTTANLRHPNILPLFDSGEGDGFLFYVMPFVEGESLRDRSRASRNSRSTKRCGSPTKWRTPSAMRIAAA